MMQLHPLKIFNKALLSSQITSAILTIKHHILVSASYYSNTMDNENLGIHSNEVAMTFCRHSALGESADTLTMKQILSIVFAARTCKPFI